MVVKILEQKNDLVKRSFCVLVRGKRLELSLLLTTRPLNERVCRFRHPRIPYFFNIFVYSADVTADPEGHPQKNLAKSLFEYFSQNFVILLKRWLTISCTASVRLVSDSATLATSQYVLFITIILIAHLLHICPSS